MYFTISEIMFPCSLTFLQCSGHGDTRYSCWNDCAKSSFPKKDGQITIQRAEEDPYLRKSNSTYNATNMPMSIYTYHVIKEKLNVFPEHVECLWLILNL